MPQEDPTLHEANLLCERAFLSQDREGRRRLWREGLTLSEIEEVLEVLREGEPPGRRSG